MTFEIAEKILLAHHGAKFYKADLHIHTPASRDWDDHNKPEFSSANITPDQIVKAALDASLDIIAITDHNSVEWCENVILAAKGTKLTVLPGFELTARPGVHILALFPPEIKIESLRKLLTKLGINEFGLVSEMSTDAIEDKATDFKVIRYIREIGGLVIPAHIDIDSGIVGRLKGGVAVKDFFDNTACSILEIKKNIPEIILSELHNDPNKYAIISGSDSHQLSEIGNKAIWIKMDAPNLNGLAQIGFEPLSRICKLYMKGNNKSKILGMYSNGGILGDQVFGFNEDLNCIIGGRGSGKSTIIDYLRFVFGGEPLDEDLKNKFRKRLVDLIHDSTTVYILVEDSAGKLWLYERMFTYTSSQRANITKYEIISPDATVYQVLVDQNRLVKFENDVPLFRIEFYGQGEVQSITDTAEPVRQLKLVDNYAQASIQQRQRKGHDIEKELETIESQILEYGDELEEIKIEISELDKLKKRVVELEKDLQDNHIKDHQIWEDAENWAKKSIEHAANQVKKLDNLNIEVLEEKTFAIPNHKSNASLNVLLHEIYSIVQSLKKIETSKNQYSDQQKKLMTLYSKWIVNYENELSRYTAVLRKQGVENLASLNKELSEKRSQIERIEIRLIPRKFELEKSISKLFIRRKKQLKGLWANWDEIRNCRILAADHMTKKLGKDVIVRISDKRNLETYFTFLDSNVPTGIQSREKQLQKIVDYDTTPDGIAKLIRNKDLLGILNIGVTENTAKFLFQVSERALMQLERIYRSEIVNIKLVLDGNEKLLSDLSDGEKCTAILSVILLDETCPLIIDQPEDELDHAFIMSNVVNTLKAVKQKTDNIDNGFTPQKGRQFIIATHNQNIPVLGDSEMVFKMKKISGQNRCEFESAFGLENSQTIKHILSLEGGSDAFERRRRKYTANQQLLQKSP